MYETFDHTADLGIRARADDLDSLFADAARGLFSVLVANPETIRPVQKIEIRVTGEDLELLLFDWLSELLYTFETQKLLLAEFHVRLETGGLQAVCSGEPLDPQRHDMDHEVKAITYHALKVSPTENGYLAEVIVDI